MFDIVPYTSLPVGNKLKTKENNTNKTQKSYQIFKHNNTVKIHLTFLYVKLTSS